MNEPKNKNQDKKNLLLIVPSLSQGGFEKICVETARIMRDDYEVTLLIFDGRNAHYDVSGINVIDINMPPAGSRAGKIFTLMRRASKIKRIKTKYKTDISYSFGSSANLANVMSRTKSLTVTSLHSSMDFDSPGRMKKVTAASDIMVSCSAALRDRLKSEYGFDKCAVLYNPFDIESITEQGNEEVSDLPFKDLESRQHVICTVGRDDNAKGYWHLIKAFYLLSREIHDARLMIIGSGEMKRERELISALNMNEKIVLTGVKKNPFPYVKSAGLFVLSSNHEGFPNVLIEALALGKPVLATDCFSGPREILLSAAEYAGMKKDGLHTAGITGAFKGEYGVLVPDMRGTLDYNASNITDEDRRFANDIKAFIFNKELLSEYAAKAALRAGEFGTDRYRQTLRGILG